MRLFINCALLATVAVLSAAQDSDPRQKRDLSLIRDLLSGKVFGDPAPIVLRENAKIYKVQGLNGVVVKAVPKAKLKVELPQVDETAMLNAEPRIKLVSSYLGTRTLNETLIALENIKRLLESGVLHTQEEIDKVVPPFIFDSSKILVSDELKTPVHTVPDFNRYNLNLKSHTTNPLQKCCSAIAASDNKNVIITESNVPLQMPSYVSSHSETPESKIYADRLAIHTYDTPEEINPYMPLNVAPVQIPEEFVYHNTFLDDIIPTYAGLTETENSKDEKYAIYEKDMEQYPFIFPINQIDNIAENQYRVYYPESERINISPIYPIEQSFIPVHYFEQPIKEVKAGSFNVPSGYSYTSIHKDGTKTTYTNSGIVKQESNYYTSTPNQNNDQNNVVVLHNVNKVQPLPNFIVNRIENAAATAHKIQFPYSPVKNTPVYSSPTHQTIHEPSADKVKVTIGSHLVNNADYSKIPSGYSYTTVHKDGSATTHSNSGLVKQDTINYFKENKVGESQRDHETKVVVLQANKPAPLPGIIINRIKNAVTAAASVKIPNPVGVEDTVYVTPVPKYQTVHKITFDGHANHADTSKVSSQYSYTTVHKDGTQTTYSDAGLVKENEKKNITGIEKIKGHYHGTIYCDDSSHVIDIPKQYQAVIHSKPSVIGLLHPTVSENHVSEQSHIQIPGSVTVTPLFLEKNNEESQKILISKPIVSKYSYKQTNHNMPDKFTVVQVGEDPSILGKINAQQTVNVTPNSLIVNTASMPTYDVFIPPITDNHISTDNKNTKMVSGFSFKHVSNSEQDNSEVTTKATKSDVILLTKHQEDDLPTETIVTTSSDNSLNANPIIVLPEEPTFSYKQEKIDGSSVKIVGDSKNVVSIFQQGTTEHNVHRGDIPETIL